MHMCSKSLQQRFNSGEAIEFEKPTLVLASASPRRAKLLRDAKITHVQVVSTVDDTELNIQFPHTGIGKAEASKYADSMALAKLKPFIGKVRNGAVITADTIIFCKGRILEKPLTKERCKEQHEFLSGKTNVNYTAYAVYYNGKIISKVMPTKVRVKKLPLQIIESICNEPEILDCAGYRNQGQINPYLWFNKKHAANLTGLYVPFLLAMLKKIDFFADFKVIKP